MTTRSTKANVEPVPERKASPVAHLIAGGIGGMAGALVTSPLDVLKTRLQSDYYKSRPVTVLHKTLPGRSLQHVVDTGRLLAEISRVEGPRALYRGLLPNLLGVVPARSINFFTYGNTKDFLARRFNHGQENSYIHLASAATAGIATSTATNPIWLVKTRLQLDRNPLDPSKPMYTSSMDCLKQVLRREGIRGLYAGLSASYLGVSESTLQWVSYEYFKAAIARRTERRRLAGLPNDTAFETTFSWVGKLGAAASAKLVAAGIAYPHEVIRTRMRQAPKDGIQRYISIKQTFLIVLKEEGIVAFYGGLTAHLLRVVPNAIILFGTYEYVLNFFKNF